MAYSKHNFQAGDVLYASQLNDIDNQIAQNEATAASASSTALANASSISALTTKVNSNETAASTNTSSISGLTTRVASLEQSVANTQSQSGINTALKQLATDLKTLLTQIAYTVQNSAASTVISDATVLVNAIDGSGNVGATYTVSKTLTKCTINNQAISVAEGAAFSAVLTANGGTAIQTVTVSMGGQNITSTAWNSNTNTISIGSVTGNISIVAVAVDEVAEVTYTPQVLYSNYSPDGARFSTQNLSVNFANGDYIEALIDTTTCTVDAENILSVGKESDSYITSFNEAVALMMYRRAQSGVDKILVRMKDAANNVAIDVWTVPTSYSAVLIKVDKDGVYLDGSKLTKITAADMVGITQAASCVVGARGSQLSHATYSYVTVYRKD